MKNLNIKIVFTGLVLFILGACNEVLDKELLTEISEDKVWEEEAMIKLYVNDLYSRAPYLSVFAEHYRYSDEGTEYSGNQTALTTGGMSKNSDQLSYWDYGLVRDYNVFLEKIAEAPIDDQTKTELEGEVRLLRAVYFYEMAKRYGGVPLVTTVLDPYAPVEENMVPRTKEEDVFKFIETEFDAVIPMLSDGSSKELFTKQIAHAYKARIMLWAASIAKYSTVQVNGLVGIPSSQASYYYGKALDAAKTVIGSGKYSLYIGKANKTENYMNIFLDEDNSEVILQKVYNGVEVGHSWDNANIPQSYRATFGSRCNPVWEMILSYENIDGSEDQPILGKDHLYEDGYDLLKNKDPRLHATIMYQGSSWQGSKVDTYEGIDINESPDPTNILNSLGEFYEGYRQIGKDVQPDGSQYTRSGFYIRKYMDESIIRPLGQKSSTNWIEIRLAEMYLIAAEAAFEIGQTTDAVIYLNAIRERAGITLVDQSTITIDKVRNERKVELAFENHRYWDLRRWRVSEVAFVNNGERFHGIKPIFHFPSKKYYFLLKDAESFVRTFRIEHYYNPITNGRISNNTALIENPYY